MNIDDLICELLEEPCAGEKGGVVFTSRSVELIHEIAEKCKTIPIVSSTQKQAEEYAEGITAEQVYIVEAPTKIHMRLTTRMLIPIISDKLKERGMR